MPGNFEQADKVRMEISRKIHRELKLLLSKKIASRYASPDFQHMDTDIAFDNERKSKLERQLALLLISNDKDLTDPQGAFAEYLCISNKQTDSPPLST